MAATPEQPVSFSQIAGLPSVERHKIVQQRVPLLHRWAHQLMETGGTSFEAQDISGAPIEVSQPYLAREFGDLQRLGYNFDGTYMGDILPHDVAALADEFLATLRRGRGPQS